MRKELQAELPCHRYSMPALSIEKENQRMTDNQIISNTKLEIIKASDIIISFIPAHLSWNDLEESWKRTVFKILTACRETRLLRNVQPGFWQADRLKRIVWDGFVVCRQKRYHRQSLCRNGFAVLQPYAQEKYPPLNLILFTISEPILFMSSMASRSPSSVNTIGFLPPSPQISPCASNLSRTEKSYPFQQRRSSISSVLCGFHAKSYCSAFLPRSQVHQQKCQFLNLLWHMYYFIFHSQPRPIIMLYLPTSVLSCMRRYR